MAIAGGIAAGLLQRANTGEAPVVDVSLVGMAMWMISPDIVASGLYGGDPMPKFKRGDTPNPLVGPYKTSDGRFITLMMLQADRFWTDFCQHIDRADMIDDPRFVDGAARFEHRAECSAEIEQTFASHTYDRRRRWWPDRSPAHTRTRRCRARTRRNSIGLVLSPLA